jgi:hypothetical protein
MGDNICMYSKSASSGVEFMNKKNNLARHRTAVNVLNALIPIVKLERSQFDWHKQKAWEKDEILTNKPRSGAHGRGIQGCQSEGIPNQHN